MTSVVKGIKISEKDSEYYEIYSTLIRSVRSRKDAQMLTDIYSSKIDNEELIKVMDSRVDCYGSKSVLGIEDFLDIVESTRSFIYRDDARDYVQKIFKRTNDPIQRGVVIKLIGTKPPKMQRITMKEFNERQEKKDMLVKACPHCQKLTKRSKDITYIVCGYSDKGYDWEGCQNDWCFRCGKKLCKNWFTHDLCSEPNRYHDGRCCKLQAYKKKESYSEHYCNCDKIHINHRI